MRVYLPATLPALAGVLGAAEIGPAPCAGVHRHPRAA